MLIFNPEKRYTVKQCLKHPYFEGLHNEEAEPEAIPAPAAEATEGDEAEAIPASAAEATVISRVAVKCVLLI